MPDARHGIYTIYPVGIYSQICGAACAKAARRWCPDSVAAQCPPKLCGSAPAESPQNGASSHTPPSSAFLRFGGEMVNGDP